MMHQTHYQIHPQLPGTSYSFRERIVNNKRAIGHLGSLRGYSSLLNLIPEENIGIFIATNSFSNLHGEFINQFFDRYFPQHSNSQTAEVAKLSSQELAKYVGTYRDMEYPRATMAKITGVAKEINVKARSDGTLSVQTPSLLFRGNTENTKLIPTSESGLFRRDNDDAYVFFVEDESGKITHLSNALYPKIGTYLRVPWYETITIHLGVLAFCVIFFLSAIITGIIRPILGVLPQKKIPTPKSYLTRSLAGSISILNLLFLIGLPLYLWWWGGWKLVYGVPPIVVGLLGIPILTTILSLILLVLIVLVWFKNYWSWQERSYYTLITIATVIFIPLLGYWNLLGWQF